MTDSTEPWPPAPGTGPSGGPAAPLPGAQEPPFVPPAPAPEWPQPAAVTLPPGTLSPSGTFPPSEISLPAAAMEPLPATAPPRRGRGGLVVLVALIIVGLGGVLGGGAALGKELTRKATKAEQSAALAREIASRWQRLPAGKIFPATISYDNGDGAQLTATRIGIGSETTCQSALDSSAYEQVRHFGCLAMLRATYTDRVGTQAVTVGIAVFRSGQEAQQAQGGLAASSTASGLNAMPIAGTIASTFGNAQRGTGDAQFAGPYVLLFTAGYTDGMPGSAAAGNDQLVALGTGILGALEPTLTKHASPCTMKDIKC